MTIRKLQLRRGTEAERSGVTFAEGELVYVTDTDELWIGDGSTAGGIGPFRRQATVDHGGLAGLADDDHTQYLRGDGTRHATGAFYFDDLIGLAGIISQVGTSPDLSQLNSTPSDANGARSCRWLAGGATAAVGVHYLGTLEFEHDGSGADERGRLILSLNDGADGLTPTEVLRVGYDGTITPTGSIDMAASETVDGRDVSEDGAKLDTVGMLYHVGKSATQTLTTSYADVTWTRAAVFSDAGIALQSGDAEFLVDGWSGRLLVHVDLVAQNLTASNTTDFVARVRRKASGGSYADIPNSTRYGLSVQGVIFGGLHITVAIDVTDGDLVKIDSKAQTGGGTLRLITEGCAITLQRVPAP